MTLVLVVALFPVWFAFARPACASREDFRVTTDNQSAAEIAGFVLRAGVLPKGTIFFAHGWGCDKEMMLACYRSVPRERGWNAVVSRRRRGCLACAIREAGALKWKVILRVD